MVSAAVLRPSSEGRCEVSTLAPMIRKLSAAVCLTDDEIAAFSALCEPERRMPARFDLVVEGDRPTMNFIVTSGYLARVKRHPSGKRQVTRLFVPGDLYNPFCSILGPVDHDCVSVSPVTVRPIPAAAYEGFLEAHPHIGRAFLWARLVELSTAERWIVGLGLLSAYQRLAHLFCELHVRLDAVGLVSHLSYPLPLTQEALADVLGLSAVHMNRILQSLREEKVVVLRERRLTIVDLPRLKAIAEFCPGYLHLPGLES
jgi:CRP-like cAMP-binding protein